MLLNTVELSSFITEGLGLAQLNTQAGTSGCFFCSLMAFLGKIPMPWWKFCSGAKQAVYLYQLSLAVRSFSCPAFHHHFPDVIFQPSTSKSHQAGHRGAFTFCTPTEYGQTLHPIQTPLSVLRQVVSLQNPGSCSSILTITEVTDCTSHQSSPGMISSCIELSGAKNDMSVD